MLILSIILSIIFIGLPVFALIKTQNPFYRTSFSSYGWILLILGVVFLLNIIRLLS